MYDADGLVMQHDPAKESAAAISAAIDAHNSGDVGALARAARNMSLVATGRTHMANVITKKTKGSRADVVFLSGCKDHQTSADAIEDGEATGAVSHALVKVLSTLYLLLRFLIDVVLMIAI